MEDHVADWARVEAAKQNLSLSRMLGQILAEKMHHNDAYALAMRNALKFKPIAFEGAFLTRDEIYAERLDRFR